MVEIVHLLLWRRKSEVKFLNGIKSELIKLAKIAETQPHTAYAALTHGLQSKWSYLMCITKWDTLTSSDLLGPIKEL